MTEHDVRLLPAAGGAIATSAWAGTNGQWLWAAVAWCAALAVAVLLAMALAHAARHCADAPARARLRRARDIAVLAAFTCAAVVIVCVTAIASTRQHVPASVGEALRTRAPLELTGVVIADPHSAGRDVWTGQARTAVAIRVLSACKPPCEEPTRADFSAKIVMGGAVQVGIGDTVTVTGRVSENRDGRVVATLWEPDVEVVAGARWPLAAVAQFRASARAAAASLPREVRGLVLGMVIGDTDYLPADVQADMRTTSLTHLTAVSGSHFAMVVLVFGWVLARVLAARWARAAILAIAMTGLAAVVLPEPSVLRALTMAIAIALGWWWGRPARALPALGAGVLLLLLIDPGLGSAVGFQLSVVAVIAIVVWAPHLQRRLGRWVASALARAISIPLAAWLACWPLLVTLQPGLGLYAVPANLVAAIAALPVTIIGLASAVASLMWAGLGAAGMQLAGACAWPVVWAARAFSSAPGHWLEWPAGRVGVALAIVVSASVAFASVSRRSRGGMRIAAAVVAAVTLFSAPALTFRQGPVMDDWAVVVCDVGQGDMMLVRVSDQAAAVVDTGPPGAAGAACLRRYGVRQIPLLVLTHPHADHDGAVREIAGVADISQVWVSPAAVTTGHDAGTADARATGAAISVPARGDTWTAGDVAMVVLYPDAGPSDASASAEVNDASIALSISVGGATALAWGDLETAGQAAVAASLVSPVVVDLVKVAHHGSSVQSEDLAAKVTSRVAAISVGADNSYGHPAEQTVALYSRYAAVVMTTARCGDIALGHDGAVAAACPSGVAG